ncbi:MAG: hypothetical protein LBE10_04045, partial [Treponema sp.]|nr:hypothetical protein [Treponema sp.]
MKNRFAQMGITGMALVIGLLAASCATTGGTAHFTPPNGTYHNYAQQGYVVFNSAGSSWEAARLGYRGTFDFDETTSALTLTAQQELQGLRWVDIDPIVGFTNGQVRNKYTVTLGNFVFVMPE